MATLSRSASRRRRRSRYSVFPSWLTRKRVVVSFVVMFSLVIVSAAVYGVRLSFALVTSHVQIEGWRSPDGIKFIAVQIVLPGVG